MAKPSVPPSNVSVRHRCPPMCHHCPDIQEVSDGEDTFMPWCYGGITFGLDGCHCAAREFDLAELLAVREHLRGELKRLDERIRVAQSAAHVALVALGRPRRAN